MNTQELLWKYAAGQCSTTEMEELEGLLELDESLREELRLVSEIQAALTGMQAEQPSMRFTQNVMEALPVKMYSTVVSEPLLPLYLKAIFWMVIFGASIYLAFVTASVEPTGTAIPYFTKVTSSLEAFAKVISVEAMSYSIFIIVALAILAVLDKLLARRIWQVR